MSGVDGFMKQFLDDLEFIEHVDEQTDIPLGKFT